MKKVLVSTIMLFILVIGIFGIANSMGITQFLLETIGQKKNTEAIPELMNERMLAIPTTAQQTQSDDQTSIHQTQLQGNNLNQQGLEPTEGVPPGYASDLIDVRFREGTDVEPPEEALPPDLRDAIASIRRGFSLSEEQLNRVGASRLRLWFRIALKPDVDPINFIARLKRLESVESAQFVPRPAPPPGGH